MQLKKANAKTAKGHTAFTCEGLDPSMLFINCEKDWILAVYEEDRDLWWAAGDKMELLPIHLRELPVSWRHGIVELQSHPTPQEWMQHILNEIAKG